MGFPRDLSRKGDRRPAPSRAAVWSGECGQSLVQPVVNAGVGQTAGADFAVGASALGIGELDQSLGARQVVVELLGLALEEQVLLRFTDQRRTAYLLGD